MTIRLLLFAMLALAATAPAQTSKKKSTGKTPPPSVQELIAQGKIRDAVRSASKAPATAAEAVNALLTQVDALVTERKIPEAKALLGNAEQFSAAAAKERKIGALPQDALRGRVLRLEGIQLNDRKEYSKAEGVLTQALDISKKAGDRTLEAGVRNNLGYALQHQEEPDGQSKLEQAAKEFDAARQIAEEQKDLLRAGSYNFNLGSALLQLARPEPAFNAFKRSAEQNKAAANAPLEARATLMQGSALSKVNSVSPEPVKYFDAARKMFSALGDKRNAGWSYYLMADHTAYSMKFGEAAQMAEQAAPLLAAAGDKAALGACYSFLADMYGRIGNKDKAEEYKKLAAQK
jgi:tetratricopeptide (TPR) repeat protein